MQWGLSTALRHDRFHWCPLVHLSRLLRSLRHAFGPHVPGCHCAGGGSPRLGQAGYMGAGAACDGAPAAVVGRHTLGQWSYAHLDTSPPARGHAEGCQQYLDHGHHAFLGATCGPFPELFCRRIAAGERFASNSFNGTAPPRDARVVPEYK